jgi:uncharacterized protein (TIGR02266 family)
VADPIDAEGTERDDMAQETRKGKRAPAALRVRFRAGTVEEFIEQQSPNISSGGMFIKSKSPLARGTLMVFDFQLQDGSPLIKGVGRVVWARKPEAAGKEPPGMGIKFIRVEPESLPTFQKIMAGKKPSDDSKDVVVRLGESDDISPIPMPESMPTPVSEPSPDKIAESKPKPKPVIDELSRPIKVLGEATATAPAAKDDGPPLSDIFDSTPPEGPRDGARPLAGAMTPMPVKVLTPDNSPKLQPKLVAPVKGPADEAPRKSPLGIVVAILIVLALAGGGYAAYLYATGQLTGGGNDGRGQTPTTPERPASDTTNAVVPVPIAATDAAPAAETGPAAAETGPAAADAAPTPAADAAAAADAAPPPAGGRTVEITSEPSGAPVTFNDRPIGRTPMTLTSADYQLDREFTIQLSKRGHQNWSRTIAPDDPEWGPAGGEQRLVVQATLVPHERPAAEDGGSRRRGGEDGGAPQPENPPPQDAPPPAPPPAAGSPDSNPY